MSEQNDNIEQKPGSEKPQAPRAKSVESVDDGTKPLCKDDECCSHMRQAD